jgi:hypothetical protein
MSVICGGVYVGEFEGVGSQIEELEGTRLREGALFAVRVVQAQLELACALRRVHEANKCVGPVIVHARDAGVTSAVRPCAYVRRAEVGSSRGRCASAGKSAAGEFDALGASMQARGTP